MKRLSYLYIAISLVYILIRVIEALRPENTNQRTDNKAERERLSLNQELSELKQERDKIIQLNQQSLQEIQINESKRLASEKAEQIRLKADMLEIQSTYDHKLGKIKQAQQAVWNSYIGKEYKSLTTTNSKVYTNAKVIDVNLTGISLQHQNGVSRIPFSFFKDDTEQKAILNFAKQTKQLKQWLSSEKEERKLIRANAERNAIKSFEQ